MWCLLLKGQLSGIGFLKSEKKEKKVLKQRLEKHG